MVESGENIEILKDNRPVAKIIPLARRQWLPAPEIGRELTRLGSDTTGLAEELRVVLTETTDVPEASISGHKPGVRW
jgi:antitoxin (DNA-binding transcriptional repressor) of toxin-antitoxin stability system